jgi:hypothetical protein
MSRLYRVTLFGKSFIVGWLSYKEIGVDFNYVILDDDSDMLLEQAEHFVKTDTLLGLSEDDVERAIKILNQ